MQRIILFGSSGMLGKYVKTILSTKYYVKCITRNEFNIESCDWSYLSELLNDLTKKDIIINCSGTIPQKNPLLSSYIKVNTLFPNKLNEIANHYDCKLIHITTDCVYSGKTGNYAEFDIHDSTEIYGITKSLGECINMCIIRTSIIGESDSKKGLLEWVKLNNTKSITGYINCYWNGITCLTLANIILEMINENIYWKGVQHIFSPNTISKFELCSIIRDVYNLDIKITESKFDRDKNMTLNTLKNNMFNIKTISEQITELKEYHDNALFT